MKFEKRIVDWASMADEIKYVLRFFSDVIWVELLYCTEILSRKFEVSFWLMKVNNGWIFKQNIFLLIKVEIFIVNWYMTIG